MDNLRTLFEGIVLAPDLKKSWSNPGGKRVIHFNGPPLRDVPRSVYQEIEIAANTNIQRQGFEEWRDEYYPVRCEAKPVRKKRKTHKAVKKKKVVQHEAKASKNYKEAVRKAVSRLRDAMAG
jgi:hypothetical protein